MKLKSKGFTKKEVIWLTVLAVLGIVSYLTGLDKSIAQYMIVHQFFPQLFLYLSYQYYLTYLIAGAVVLYTRKMRAVESLLLSLVILILLHMTISYVVPRERPVLNTPLITLINQMGLSSSFFSDHTASVVAICTIFLLIGYYPMTAVLLGAPIILSRLVLAHHYLSDILGGIIIGYVLTKAVYRFLTD